MEKERKLRRTMEVLWWLFTLILVIAVLAPVYLNNVKFPFYTANVLFIVIFVTVTRYAFLLKHTWIAHRRWIKYFVIFGSLLFIFVIATSMLDFNNYLEEVGLQEIAGEVPVNRQPAMVNYIQREVIFFGVGSMIGLFVLSIRMIISLWRMRHSPNRV